MCIDFLNRSLSSAFLLRFPDAGRLPLKREGASVRDVNFKDPDNLSEL